MGNTTFFYKNKKFLFLGLLSLSIFSYNFIDIPLAKVINNSKYVNNLYAHILVYIPNIITLIILIPTLIIILLHSYIKISKSHMLILHLFNSGICATFINNIIRHIIGRIDIKYGLINNFSEQSYGFVPFSHFSSLPSGHSTAIAVIATSIVLFYPRQKLLAMTLYLVVVISLILTNSHYLTDCLAGLILGLLVSITIFKYGTLND